MARDHRFSLLVAALEESKVSDKNKMKDKLRLAMFHVAYRHLKDRSPTERFVLAIAISARSMDQALAALYLSVQDQTKGLPEEDRQEAFRRACEGIGIRRRNCFGDDQAETDEPESERDESN
jgi:hypothetical protein